MIEAGNTDTGDYFKPLLTKHELWAWLDQQLGRHFVTTLAKEQAALTPIFNTAAQVLAPYAASEHERTFATPEGLSNLFAHMARACQLVMANTPVILAEGVLEEASGSNRNKLQILMEHEQDRGRARWLRIGVNGGKRLFNTGEFGFLTTFLKRPNSQYRVVHPFIALPGEFLRIAQDNDAQGLLDEFGRLSSLTNHDWYHSLNATAISAHIAPVSGQSPIHRFLFTGQDGWIFRALGIAENSVLKTYNMHRDLRQYEKIYPRRTGNDAFEDWAMRLQREILTRMADEPGNPLESCVHHYMGQWRTFAAKTRTLAPMDNIKLRPDLYALKLAAFNLVRAVPFEHKIVQDIIAETGDEGRAVFEKMYLSKMALKTLFGCGPSENAPKAKEKDICKTSEEYGAAVLDATIELMGRAQNDVRNALYGLSLPEEQATRLRWSYRKDGAPADFKLA